MKTQNSNNELKRIIITILLTITFLSSARATTINISVVDFTFTPNSFTANLGDTIKWTWIGSRDHTTTCDGVFPGTSLPPGATPWSATLNGTSPMFIYVPQVVGTYDYVCMFHAPLMVGSFVIEAPLPVELLDFVATTIKNEVILDWGTGGEINNERFEVQRIDLTVAKIYDPKGDMPYSTIGIMKGYGTTNQEHHYKFIDRNLKSGIYAYRLKQVDYNSNFIYHLLSDKIVIGIPSKFEISQNYPNPFNPVTKINYDLPEDGFVKVSLFDITGRKVSTIVNDYMSAGYQTAEINGTSLSSGVYYYRIEFTGANNSETATKRMMLIK